MAVANKASAIPGATTARFVLCMAAIAENECMIPHTVPNSPMNGAVAAYHDVTGEAWKPYQAPVSAAGGITRTAAAAQMAAFGAA